MYVHCISRVYKITEFPRVHKQISHITEITKYINQRIVKRDKSYTDTCTVYMNSCITNDLLKKTSRSEYKVISNNMHTGRHCSYQCIYHSHM